MADFGWCNEFPEATVEVAPFELDVVPLTVRVERYNDADTRTYNCQVADSRVLTASLVRSVVLGVDDLRGLGSYEPFRYPIRVPVYPFEQLHVDLDHVHLAVRVPVDVCRVPVA